jgi:hypothetical protein
MTTAPAHHLFLHGGTLCGLKAEAVKSGGPACSACLLLVSRIRREAAAMLTIAGGAVEPPTPRAAWESLRSTDWAESFDLEGFLERPNLDETIRINAFLLAVDPKSVEGLVAEWTANGR